MGAIDQKIWKIMTMQYSAHPRTDIITLHLPRGTQVEKVFYKLTVEEEEKMLTSRRAKKVYWPKSLKVI